MTVNGSSGAREELKFHKGSKRLEARELLNINTFMLILLQMTQSRKNNEKVLLDFMLSDPLSQ